MQTRSRIFDDLAKVAGGAVSTLGGIKAEIEVLVRQQIERLLLNADMVPRDEFDAVKAVAAKARSEQEKLEIRVQALEKKLGVKAPARKAKPQARPQARPKTASKKPGKKPAAKAKTRNKAAAKTRRKPASKRASKRTSKTGRKA
jgi:BMFP domain-containing protein YqiC